MTPDVFEDELRTLLHGATEAQSPAFTDVDTDAVLFTGRRIVRRRRMAVVGGTLAATLVVGAGAWAIVRPTSDRALELPATRTTSPVGGAVTAVLDEFSDLSGPDGSPLTTPGPRRLAVTVDPGAEPDLVFSSVAADGTRTVLAGSSLRGVGPLAATWGTGTGMDHVLVGVLPAQAIDLQLVTPLTDEGGHASTTVRAPLPGTARQAFATRFAEPDAASVQHLVWQGRDGSVHDETGAVLPSVRLTDTARTTVYLGKGLGRLGTFGADGATMIGLDTSRNSSGRPFLSTGRGEGATMQTLFAAVVPAGSVPGATPLVPGATLTHPLSVVPLPGTDRAVLWATFSSPLSAQGAPYRSISWSEVGRTVTQTP